MLQTLERIRETMERKIKFRGKTVSGRWVYGDLLHITNTDGISGTIIVKENQATEQSTDYDNALCYARNEIDVVIPDTVGQFTGLLDKNGKEIYEGDIIRYADIDEYVVNPDCDLHLHFSQSYVKVIEDVVIFANGAFSLSDDIYPRPISVYGIKDIKDLRDWLGIKDDEDTDCNGTIINESLLGIEIVGNICENFGIVK